MAVWHASTDLRRRHGRQSGAADFFTDAAACVQGRRQLAKTDRPSSGPTGLLLQSTVPCRQIGRLQDSTLPGAVMC